MQAIGSSRKVGRDELLDIFFVDFFWDETVSHIRTYGFYWLCDESNHFFMIRFLVFNVRVG